MNFNQMVWEALKKIPRGKVATYGQIAHAIRKPKAFRAVGSACSKNPHAPKVPCHRVICATGALGGYSGGLKKKIALLKKEGVRVKNNKIVDFKEIIVKQKELILWQDEVTQEK